MDLPLQPQPTSAITIRSVSIGTLMVAIVCGITPYNDFVIANTMMVGFYLPVISVLLMVGLVVLINGPLHRYCPKHALRAGELGVILAMLLVSCGIAGSGMMRTLIPTLISPFNRGLQDPLFWKNFTNLQLPGWMFPVENIADGRSSPIMQWFYDRVPQGHSAPYAAWIVPLLGWGVFVFAMIATMFSLAWIITPQWAVNERLPFPIAQIQQALIEPPAPGRALNSLFRSQMFWIAAGAVLIVHSMVTLHAYFPRTVPEIKLSYNLTSVFSEEPWSFFSSSLKSAAVYFSFVGLAYFISSRVSFSLWSLYLVTEIIAVQQRMIGNDMPVRGPAWTDQHVGSSVAFLAGVLWIGRHHWVKVLRQAFSRVPDPRFPRYRAAVLVGLFGPAVMVCWLLAVGVQGWVAVMIVAFVLLAHVVVARIVAETGLSFIRVLVSPLNIITNLPTSVLRGPDVFFSGVFTMNGAVNTRESIFPFMMHGLRVNDAIDPSPQKSSRGLLGAMVWAAVFGFAVAAASSLYCYYNYSLPLGDGNEAVLNSAGLLAWPRDMLADPLNRFADGRFAPTSHNPWLHMGIGMTVTGLLQAATLRWSSWPFLPIGYLVSMTWYIQLGWLSIFLGWLSKLLIIKYGGARAYQAAKPFFFGLVVGEAMAVGLWAMINLGLAMSGESYKVVQLLPY